MNNPSPVSDPLENLRETLRLFATERGWNQFHTPRNLAIAFATAPYVGYVQGLITAFTDA